MARTSVVSGAACSVAASRENCWNGYVFSKSKWVAGGADKEEICGGSDPLRQKAKEVLAALWVLGVVGILPPAISDMLHNLSTLGVSLRSMNRLTPQAKSALRNNLQTD